MIYKGIFRMDIMSEDPVAEIQWVGAHPGNEIEILLKGFSEKLLEEEKVLNICYTLSDTFFYLHWNGDHGHFLLQSADLSDFQDWVSGIWALVEDNRSYDQCMELVQENPNPYAETFQKVSFEKLSETFPSKNKKLLSKYTNFQTFVNLLYSLTSIRPWLLNTLDSIIINSEENSIIVNYSSEFLEKINLQNLQKLEESVYNGDQDGAYLLGRATMNCFNYFYDTRHRKFAEYMDALTAYFSVGSLEYMALIKVLSTYLATLLELDKEFFIDKIASVLSAMTSSSLEVDTHVVQTVFDLSMNLYDNQVLDLAKIAEGSAFELSLQLEDLETRGEFFKKFMNSSIRWGGVHVMGFLNIMNGIIGDSKEEQSIYADIIEPSVDIVGGVEGGKQALVEAFLKSNQIDKAVESKFSITDEILDDEQMAREIFKSIRWMITQEAISQKVLRNILETYLPRALDKSIPGEALHKEIQYIYEDMKDRELDALMVRVTSVIIKNLNSVALIDRFDLLDLIYSQLLCDKKFSDLAGAVRGKMFEVAIEEGMEDQAEEIFQEILGMLDPESKNYHESFIRFCKRVLLASAKYNGDRYIDFVIDMISSVINTQELINTYKNDIFDLITEAIKNADSIPPTKEEHPGIRLYKHAYRLALLFDSPDLVNQLIHNAPSYAFSKKDYAAYSKFTLLQIHINRSQRSDWMGTLLKAMNTLIGVKEYDILHELLAEIMNEEIDTSDLLTIYKRELEIAEKVDLNFLTPEEIQTIRDRIIELSKGNESTESIFIQYDNSIEELLEMGKVFEGIKKILEVVEYSINTGNSPSKYIDQLLELFTSVLETESNFKIIQQVIFYTVRTLTNLVNGAPLTVLPFIKISARKFMKHKSVTPARVFLRETLTTVSESMDQLGITDKKELHTIISDFEKSLHTRKGDINSYLLNFKIRFELYVAVRNGKKLIDLVSDILSKLKESSYKEKKVKGSLITAIFTISQSFIELSDTLDQNEKRRYLFVVIDYFDSITPLVPLSSDVSGIINEIMQNLKDNPDGTLYNLGFYIKSLQEAIDNS